LGVGNGLTGQRSERQHKQKAFHEIPLIFSDIKAFTGRYDKGSWNPIYRAILWFED
jgi:hypothetical protein